MTDESRGPGGAFGPPWSVDVLADLHAGVLDDRAAAELWPRINADPEAMAVIEALESTRVDLAGLAAAPVEPMPAHFAARMDAALAEEARQAFVIPPQRTEQGVAPVLDLAEARRRRNRRLGWGGGVLTVAAAAAAAIAIVVPNSGNDSSGTPPVAQPPPSQGATGAPPALRSDNPEAALREAMGAKDFGPLGDQDRLDACLRVNGFDPVVKPVGVRTVTVDGKPAVLVVMTTGKAAQFRLVAFPPTCGPGSPGTLLDKTVGDK